MWNWTRGIICYEALGFLAVGQYSQLYEEEKKGSAQVRMHTLNQGPLLFSHLGRLPSYLHVHIKFNVMVRHEYL